ncbi:flagellar assembly protein FliH [Thalassobacillus pellis]|uniref:flagellar assembly protein FliH n=1 Tax=Thalassobacillus pellis TaxID=748008 RepID=UPI003083FB51
MVEEMISLSDSSEFHGPNTRVIKLRPVAFRNNQSPEKEQEDYTNTHQRANQKLIDAEKQLDWAHKEADRIIQHAKREIQKEKETWESEKKALVRQAEETGFSEGLKNGQKQGFEEYRENISKSRTIIDKAKEDYRQIVASSEEMILDLSIEAARKILKHYINEKKENFLFLVKAVLKEVQQQPEIMIYVHPDKYDLLLTQKEELENCITAKSELLIYAKDDVDPLHCMIETPFGSMNASVDEQLLEIRRKLFELYQEGDGNE